MCLICNKKFAHLDTCARLPCDINQIVHGSCLQEYLNKPENADKEHHEIKCPFPYCDKNIWGLGEWQYFEYQIDDDPDIQDEIIDEEAHNKELPL